MAHIYENIDVTLRGAEENLAKLFQEYEHCLRKKEVSVSATDLTHQICTQLRSVLDRIAFRYWSLKIAPDLSEKDRTEAKSRIYFPAGASQAAMDSTLGNWRWKPIREKHQELYDYLSAQQPFNSEKNKWLSVLFDLSVQGKHIDLVPQKRTEQKRVTVERGGGKVSWDPAAVKFGGGQVRILGMPFNPANQMVEPTEDAKVTVENWVSFVIDGHNVNAASFCKEACLETRRIVQEMTDKFQLS